MWGEPHHSIPSGKCLFGKGFIFQYHSDHVCLHVNTHIVNENISLLLSFHENTIFSDLNLRLLIDLKSYKQLIILMC